MGSTVWWIVIILIFAALSGGLFTWLSRKDKISKLWIKPWLISGCIYLIVGFVIFFCLNALFSIK